MVGVYETLTHVSGLVLSELAGELIQVDQKLKRQKLIICQACAPSELGKSIVLVRPDGRRLHSQYRVLLPTLPQLGKPETETYVVYRPSTRKHSHR